MKHINAKRIAAVALGTALLGMGVASAASVVSHGVAFQNVTVISNSGVPAVQIALGYNGTYPASITDGVAAADIAAAIGNLAYTTSNISVSVNKTAALKVLTPVVSSSAYKLTDQEVYLNESSKAYVSGSYNFGALIGSVLNRGIKLSVPSDTKAVGKGYGYPVSYSLTSSPQSSPYTAVGMVPLTTPVTASINGGGVSFSSFTNGSIDNVLRLSNSQVPSLLSASGPNGENEYLWLTGFPVYDQQNSSFELMNAGGAYEADFNTPILAYSNATSKTINHASIDLLNKNWTIANYIAPTVSTHGTTTYTVGGKLRLASAVSNVTTLYLDHYLNSTPFGVELAGFSEPNSAGVSQPIFHIYYNGALVNSTTVDIGTTTKFNVSGKHIYVYVKTASADVFQSASYAKVQLYTNVFNVTSGAKFNSSNPGWYTELMWTNTSTSNTANPELAGIVLYNTSPTTLAPGQSFSFVTDPAIWSLKFTGQSLTSSDRDPVTASVSEMPSITYKNLGTNVPVTNITEPGQVMKVTSGISNAFSYDGELNNTVEYLLTPYAFNYPTPHANSTVANAATDITLSSSEGNYITKANPLTVMIKGYTSSSAPAAVSVPVTFNTSSNTISIEHMYNITGITVNRALPDLTISASAVSGNALASLTTNTSGMILLTPSSGKNYQGLGAATTVSYNQNDGIPPVNFTLTSDYVSGAKGLQNAYFKYDMPEYDVPNNEVYMDDLSFSILNSTAGEAATNLFQLNYSAAANGYSGNNMTYLSSQGKTIKAPVGFYTEKGSEVAAISPSSLTVDMAKGIDKLDFMVAPYNVSAIPVHYKVYGPYSIGEATNIPNVSIANVTANATISSSANYTIKGISNLDSNKIITTTPSVADVQSNIKSELVPGSPSGLVILDTQANPSSSLILVGSGYVNTLSAQIQKAYNISINSTSAPVVKAFPSSTGSRILVAGYTANQTEQAAKTFIEDLYASAASS